MATVTFRLIPDVTFDGGHDIIVSDGPKPTIETPMPHLTRCIVAFFQNDTEVSEMRKTYTSDEGYESDGLTVSVQMSEGQTYSIVVYMDNNKDYIDVTNLKAITLAKEGYILDGDPQIFSSDKFDITVTGDTSKDVIVLRRYCRLSFIDTNPTSEITQKVYQALGYIANGFNAYLGRPNDSIAGIEFINTSVAILAGPTSTSAAFSLGSYNSSGEMVKIQNVLNIPIDRNYRVNVYWSSAPQKSVDLATAFPDKWAALDPGEHTIQIRAKNPGNYLDSDLSTAKTFVKVVNYAITANLTNCVGVSSNPTTIASNTTGTVLTFTANTGYDLPASVTVTGATSSWNRSTGELTLTKPTGNVTITIAATAKTYNITVNATNATAASTNPTTIVYGAGAQLKFTFPDGYYAPTAVTVTGATQIWDAGTGALTLSNCTGPVTVDIEGATKTYTITPAITNCTWNGKNPTTIASNQFTPIQLDIIKNTGWTLPTEISVSGVDAEYWSWNQSTGIVTISHPQGNVTVTASAVREVYSITTNLTHAVAGSGNPTTVGYGLNATLTFTFPTGYEAPADVTVTGATKSWEAGTGTLTLTNATGPVTVTVVGVATTTTIDGGTYKWLDNAALTQWTQEINFTSNGASYSGMRYTGNGTAMTLQYMNADSEWQTVYNYDEDASTGSWVNDTYKIVDLGTSAQTVTAIFKTDFIANTTKLTQLSTPQNVTADGTVVSWDEVENATSYEVLADGTSIGTVDNVTEDQLAGTWVFNDSLNISDDITWNVNYTTNSEDYTDLRISLQAHPSGTAPCMGTASFPTLFYNMGSWDDRYKTITITSKLSEVTNGEQLLAWLQANATKQ